MESCIGKPSRTAGDKRAVPASGCTARRRFLQGLVSGIAAPCIVPASALGRAGRPAPSDRIVMGCIGVGGQGTRQMAGGIWSPEGGFVAQPAVQIVAVCDVNARRRQQAQEIIFSRYGNRDCAAYRDFRELLARPDIDAVLSATGERWHARIGIAAVRAGKDVYSEKPVSVTVEEARILADTVRRYGAIFQIGTQQRSMFYFRHACELVRNGYIGQVKHITFDLDGGPGPCDLPAGGPVPDWLDYDLWLGPAPWRPYHPRVVGGWMAYYDYSGGDMTNWGAHVLDVVQWGLGMDESGPLEILPPDGKNARRLTYRYAGGVVCERGPIPGVTKGILFRGTEGYVKVSREVLETEPASLRFRNIRPGEIELHRSPEENHHTDFLWSVRTRARNASDADVACRSITVCHLGNIAVELGRPLRWDPARERFPDDPQANRLLRRPSRSPYFLSA